MVRQALVIWALVALLGGASVGTAQDETAVSFLKALQGAPASARAQISKLIAEKCPTLPDDIAKLIVRERPNFYSDIQPDLDKLVRSKYPKIPTYVGTELGKVPAVQDGVETLIAEKYPELTEELLALPPGPDRARQAQELVRNKYPDLLRDVLALLRQKHPKLLAQIQRKVQAKFPTFIADAGSIILAKYPELTSKIMAMVAKKHSAILPGILAILQEAGREAEAEGAEGGSAGSDAEEAAPAVEAGD